MNGRTKLLFILFPNNLYFCFLKVRKIEPYSCVLFVTEKKYTVLRHSLIKNSKKGTTVRKRGIDYTVVVFCTGSKAAFEKRSLKLEKTLATHAGSDDDDNDDDGEDDDDGGVEDDDGVNDDTHVYDKISRNDCAADRNISFKSKKRAKMVTSQSFTSITNEYLLTKTVSTQQISQ